jgi:uncharacterized SAM-binding protein YcdF (DUF218 family)
MSTVPRLRLPAFYAENVSVYDRFSREFPPTPSGNPLPAAQALHRNSVTTIHLHTAPPQNADLIFVLAGREYRKQYALELFKLGLAPKILFSVSRFEIRRFSKLPLPAPLDLLKLASDIPPPQRHFFVLFERSNVQVIYVRPRRLGTMTEIETLSRWLLNHPEVNSIVLISSHSHLPRIRLCCRFLLSGNLHISLASPPAQLSRVQFANRFAAGLLESIKTVAYAVVLALRRGRPRTNSAIRDRP